MFPLVLPQLSTILLLTTFAIVLYPYEQVMNFESRHYLIIETGCKRKLATLLANSSRTVI